VLCRREFILAIQSSNSSAMKKKKKNQTKPNLAGGWWFTPVNLATQEAEIRIVVQNQP
jgi:hypothetical protein